MRPEVSIVIPAYNEEERIGDALAGCLPFFKKYNLEIIVIADGTDNTPSIVERWSRENGCVRLLRSPERLGKGGAVRWGLGEAGGDAVGFMDADGAVEAGEFEKLLRELDRFEGAIASRRLPGSRALGPEAQSRRFFRWVFNRIANRLFGLGIRDTQCGAKVFRRDALRAVLPGLVCTGFEFDVELLWRFQRAGYTLREVPVSYRPKRGTKFHLYLGPVMIAKLVRIRWMRRRTS